MDVSEQTEEEGVRGELWDRDASVGGMRNGTRDEGV